MLNYSRSRATHFWFHVSLWLEVQRESSHRRFVCLHPFGVCICIGVGCSIRRTIGFEFAAEKGFVIRFIGQFEYFDNYPTAKQFHLRDRRQQQRSSVTPERLHDLVHRPSKEDR